MLGLGSVVIGVSVPPGRYVGHNMVVDTQEKADALPTVDPRWERLRDELVEVYQELAAHHLKTGDPGPRDVAAMTALDDGEQS